MGKLLIDESTLTDIGNAIRQKKGTSGLIQTTNMKNEILSIQGGGGSSEIDGGYTVNFYDTENNLIESHSAKYGNQIGEPLDYSPLFWKDSDGERIWLPLTVTDDMGINVLDIFEGVGDSYADKLYQAYNIDPEEYPVTFIKQYLISGASSYSSCALYFAKSFTRFDNSRVTINSAMRANPYAYVEPIDTKQIVDALCDIGNSGEYTFESMAAQNSLQSHYIYTNTGEKLDVASNKWYDLNILYGDDNVELFRLT